MPHSFADYFDNPAHSDVLLIFTAEDSTERKDDDQHVDDQEHQRVDAGGARRGSQQAADSAAADLQKPAHAVEVCIAPSETITGGSTHAAGSSATQDSSVTDSTDSIAAVSPSHGAEPAGEGPASGAAAAQADATAGKALLIQERTLSVEELTLIFERHTYLTYCTRHINAHAMVLCSHSSYFKARLERGDGFGADLQLSASSAGPTGNTGKAGGQIASTGTATDLTAASPAAAMDADAVSCASAGSSAASAATSSSVPEQQSRQQGAGGASTAQSGPSTYAKPVSGSRRSDKWLVNAVQKWLHPSARQRVLIERGRTEDELMAVHYMIRFMYSGDECDLPVTCLDAIMDMADCWDMTSVLAAALKVFVKATNSALDAKTVNAAFRRAPDSMRKEVETKCREWLLAHFGDVHQLMTQAKSRAQFAALQLPAVQLWATLDELVCDTEAAVVSVLCTWIAAQQAPAAGVEQYSALATAVRVCQLNTNFRTTVIPSLGWFNPHSKVLASVNVVMGSALLCQGSPVQVVLQRVREHVECVPTEWVKPARKAPSPDVLQTVRQFQWYIPFDVLRSAMQKAVAEQDKAALLFDSSTRAAFGMYWQLHMRLKNSQGLFEPSLCLTHHFGLPQAAQIVVEPLPVVACWQVFRLRAAGTWEAPNVACTRLLGECIWGDPLFPDCKLSPDAADLGLGVYHSGAEAIAAAVRLLDVQ